MTLYKKSYLFLLLFSFSFMQMNGTKGYHDPYFHHGNKEENKTFNSFLFKSMIFLGSSYMLYKFYKWYTYLPNIPQLVVKYEDLNAILVSNKSENDKINDIRLHVTLYSRFNGQAFNFVRFVKELEEDMKNISEYYLPYAHKDRYNWSDKARALLYTLSDIKKCIITDPDYSSQAAKYEKYLQNKKLVKAEQDKAHAKNMDVLFGKHYYHY